MAEIQWNLLNVPNIGETFSNAYKGAQENRALTNYAQNPNDPNALNALAPFKPDYVVQQKQALAKQQQDEVAKRVEIVGQAAQWADTPEKWDAAIDNLSRQYPDLAQYKGKFTPEARMAAISAAGQMKDYYASQKAQQEASRPMIAGPGSRIISPDGSKVLQEIPFAPRPVTVGEGQTVVEYNPSHSGPLTVDNFLPAIVKQESGGNYKAVNRESGAMGAYQVMPATGQSLAGQIGLPWRPDLMTSDTPEAKQYQDQIGRAAVKEAVDASGGNPVEAAMYYHGGSDKSKWGPRTQQYGREVAARLGNGTNVIAQGPPKQEKPKEPPAGYRWKADGSLEPIPGGPADKPGAGGSAGNPAYSQSAMDAFDRAINTANGLLKHPGFSAAVGSAFDPAAFGSFNPFTGKTLAGTDAADFRTNLDTMKAQVFLPMVQSMKGMGALSNAEGEKLTAAIGNLSTDQSEAQFKSNVQQIIADLTTYKNRANAPKSSAPSAPVKSGGPVRINSDADYNRLKSGAVFVGPDGQVRRKP